MDSDDCWPLASRSTDHDDDLVFPVGGMRRVSSCYFSICSNISSDENDIHTNNCTSLHHGCDSPFPVDDAATTGTTGDYLYHDILMNVFTFLDAASLAAFSETARRPNFECFYFLELQLQRALLRGATTANSTRYPWNAAEEDVMMDPECRDGIRRWRDEDGLLFISGTGAISRVSVS